MTKVNDNYELPEKHVLGLETFLIVESENDWGSGKVITYTINGNGYTMEDYLNNGESKSVILLDKRVVEIDLSNHEIDIKNMRLKALEEKKEAMIARHFVELKNVEDQIQNLKAIEYQPGTLVDEVA